MLKQGQGVDVEVRPDCMMRDFSNTAQWNKPTRLPLAPLIEVREAHCTSTEVTPVDDTVTPERLKLSVCKLAQPASADTSVTPQR